MEIGKTIFLENPTLLVIFFTGMGISFFVTAIAHLFARLKRKIARRKSDRAEVERRLVYTLPDRENSYVRTRLNTTLYVKDKEAYAEPAPMKLGYAQELLLRLKNLPLTTAERLQIDEMDAIFSVFIKKEKWTASDVSCANDLCAALLKLSAKYSI